MAEIQHLKRAPIIEAILGFEVDASKSWIPEVVKAGMPEKFPDFSEIQEQRMFENQISVAPGKAPETHTKVHPVQALIAKKPDQTSAVQIRRDGFAFSQLQPYPNWDSFVASALAEWNVFKQWLEVEEPFNMFVRFINRLAYPRKGFQLATYFENPPEPPSGTHWPLSFFRDRHAYAARDGKFSVHSVFSSPERPTPESTVQFILDLTIKPSRPLAESENSIDTILLEMRELKNQAFFAMLTDEGLAPYR